MSEERASDSPTVLQACIRCAPGRRRIVLGHWHHQPSPRLHPTAADTPGYAAENETKPALCKAVNAALGSELFTPKQVRTLCGSGLLHHSVTPAGSRPLAAGHRSPSWTACSLQVAASLLRGIEAGAYHLPSPDLGQNLLVSGMTSLRCAWVGG